MTIIVKLNEIVKFNLSEPLATRIMLALAKVVLDCGVGTNHLPSTTKQTCPYFGPQAANVAAITCFENSTNVELGPKKIKQKQKIMVQVTIMDNNQKE